MNPNEIKNLLQDCLSQFEALNNSCRFTHSQELRDRLRIALELPAEVDVNACEEEESEDFDVMLLGTEMAALVAEVRAEEYEPNVYDGTYSEA